MHPIRNEHPDDPLIVLHAACLLLLSSSDPHLRFRAPELDTQAAVRVIARAVAGGVQTTQPWTMTQLRWLVEALQD